MLAWVGSAQADGGNLAELRVTARVPDDGGIEFAVQSRSSDGDWGERILPRVRRFPNNATVGRWLYSSPVIVPGHVESDLSIRIDDGGFVVRADGLEYSTPCDYLWIRRLSRVVSVTTEHPPDCRENAAPVTVLSRPAGQLSYLPEDPQRQLVYDWESTLDRSVLPTYLQDRIPLREAQAIAEAVYSDHFRGRERAPRVRLVGIGDLGEAAGQYSSGTHEIMIESGQVSAELVLHELAHALVATAGLRGVGHDAEFVAQRMALWDRYLPDFDLTTARAAAAQQGVDLNATLPARATGGASQLAAVRAAIGVPDDATLTVGAPPGPSGIASLDAEIVVRIAARRLEDGRVEFALQPQQPGREWSGRTYPAGRFLGANPPTGRWLNSTPVQVGSGGAAIPVGLNDDALGFRAGGATLNDPCGSSALLRGNRVVWHSILDSATCSEWGPWEAIIFNDDASRETDPENPHFAQFGDWWNHLRYNDMLAPMLDDRITLSEAEGIAEAVLTDYSGGRLRGRLSFVQIDDGVRVQWRVWQNRSRWYDVWWTVEWLDAVNVLRIVSRALVDIERGYGYVAGRGGGDSFGNAQLISIWDRYLPGFDADEARRLARVHSLPVASGPPVRPTGGAFERAVVRTLLSGS